MCSRVYLRMNTRRQNTLHIDNSLQRHESSFRALFLVAVGSAGEDSEHFQYIDTQEEK